LTVEDDIDLTIISLNGCFVISLFDSSQSPSIWVSCRCKLRAIFLIIFNHNEKKNKSQINFEICLKYHYYNYAFSPIRVVIIIWILKENVYLYNTFKSVKNERK